MALILHRKRYLISCLRQIEVEHFSLHEKLIFMRRVKERIPESTLGLALHTFVYEISCEC